MHMYGKYIIVFKCFCVGLCGLCPSPTCALLAFPGKSIGCVNIVNLNSDKAPSPIAAHETQLSCISLNQQGTWLATASEKVHVVNHMCYSKILVNYFTLSYARMM